METESGSFVKDAIIEIIEIHWNPNCDIVVDVMLKSCNTTYRYGLADNHGIERWMDWGLGRIMFEFVILENCIVVRFSNQRRFKPPYVSGPINIYFTCIRNNWKNSQKSHVIGGTKRVGMEAMDVCDVTGFISYLKKTDNQVLVKRREF